MTTGNTITALTQSVHTLGVSATSMLEIRPKEPYNPEFPHHTGGTTRIITSLSRQHQLPLTHHSELPKLLVVVTRVSHPSVMGVASRAIYELTVPMFASRAMEGSIIISKGIIMHQIE